jgi:hypothetical protein
MATDGSSLARIPSGLCFSCKKKGETKRKKKNIRDRGGKKVEKAETKHVECGIIACLECPPREYISAKDERQQSGPWTNFS